MNRDGLKPIGDSRDSLPTTRASFSAIYEDGGRRIASREADVRCGEGCRHHQWRYSACGDVYEGEQSVRRWARKAVACNLAEHTGACLIARRSVAARAIGDAVGPVKVGNFWVIMETGQPEKLNLGEES